jgi:hypothetical protein
MFPVVALHTTGLIGQMTQGVYIIRWDFDEVFVFPVVSYLQHKGAPMQQNGGGEELILFERTRRRKMHLMTEKGTFFGQKVHSLVVEI